VRDARRAAQGGDESLPEGRVGEELRVHDDPPESQSARHLERILQTSELEERRSSDEVLQQGSVPAVSVDDAVTVDERAEQMTGGELNVADRELERGTVSLRAQPFVRRPLRRHIRWRERSHVNAAGVAFGE